MVPKQQVDLNGIGLFFHHYLDILHRLSLLTFLLIDIHSFSYPIVGLKFGPVGCMFEGSGLHPLGP